MRADEIQLATLRGIGADLLSALGYDPDTPGLRDTPDRWARWWQQFVNYQDDTVNTTFLSLGVDQMVVVSGVRVWSICEHHLLPFWCDLTMAYVPRGEVLGLSKFARIAQRQAHKLQLQERLVADIADEIAGSARSPDVAVLGIGEHLCMTMRGARSPHRMQTSVLRGSFKTSPDTRQEFFHLAGAAP